jgi:hypothetical protein
MFHKFSCYQLILIQPPNPDVLTLLSEIKKKNNFKSCYQLILIQPPNPDVLTLLSEIKKEQFQVLLPTDLDPTT